MSLACPVCTNHHVDARVTIIEASTIEAEVAAPTRKSWWQWAFGPSIEATNRREGLRWGLSMTLAWLVLVAWWMAYDMNKPAVRSWIHRHPDLGFSDAATTVSKTVWPKHKVHHTIRFPLVVYRVRSQNGHKVKVAHTFATKDQARGLLKRNNLLVCVFGDDLRAIGRPIQRRPLDLGSLNEAQFKVVLGIGIDLDERLQKTFARRDFSIRVLANALDNHRTEHLPDLRRLATLADQPTIAHRIPSDAIGVAATSQNVTRRTPSAAIGGMVQVQISGVPTSPASAGQVGAKVINPKEETVRCTTAML